MTIAEGLLPEFDHEMANTRKTLERVPESKFGWKPHEKSYTLGKLATHIATLPVFAAMTIAQDDLDLGKPFPAPAPKTRDEIVALFDENMKAARAAIACASDQTLMKNWSLKQGTHVIFTMPKVAVLRSFVMNHTIHHRAQLLVYLRLNDIPVPGLYGPSADEQ
jgi:uncharacterized damage-inducible protein DinB